MASGQRMSSPRVYTAARPHFVEPGPAQTDLLSSASHRGTSLTRYVLFPNFSWWRRCKVNYDDKMRYHGRGLDPRSWPLYARKGIRLLAGHMPFGFGQNFPGPSEYFTFVRNPIARAVSDYHFCRSNSSNPAFPAATKLSLKE